MTPSCHILVVDPDDDLLSLVGSSLTLGGHSVSQAGSLAGARDLLKEFGFQLILTGLALDDGSGLEILAHVQESAPQTPVIVMTDLGQVEAAVQAMELGAFDFLEKPFNQQQMLIAVNRALERATLSHAYDYLRHEQPYIYNLDNILAESPPMKRVLEQVSRVAPADVTVLLTGETGTGKSLIAGAIHANSKRRDGALVTVNCAALTETLLESELFGHEKGAFTGAHKSRTGRFQQAHGGSLFLDEVGDMSPATQAKVLRAIEEKVITKVGGSRSIHVDVRIIAATNADMAQAVEEGAFRRDLYYRLNVTPILIPPLRERRPDVLPLANLFLKRIQGESKHSAPPLSQAAQHLLLSHDWPGNIRELRNVIERAVLFSTGSEIQPEDLGLAPEGDVKIKKRQDDPPSFNLGELERWAIYGALEQCDWVQSRAAELLGITPRALSYKINKLAITHPELDARRRYR